MKRQSLELLSLSLYNDQSSKNTSTLKAEPSPHSMNLKNKKKKMAIHHKTLDTTTTDSSSLFCEEVEPRWEEEEEEDEDDEGFTRPTLKPLFLVDDLVPAILLQEQDEELHRLFSKEQQQDTTNLKEAVSSVSTARTKAVNWMLTAVADHSFSPATALVAVNYLERFLSSFYVGGVERDNKPWMIQLVAVTCLSLAAKVEETHVPLLIDLQVGDVKYLFEAKTIQKMELLVLSTLKWKMHPVTPLSFIYHIINRLGFNTHYLYWDFLTRCENLLLAAISDSRCMGCLPSVLASATMMNVLDEVQFYGSIHYNNHLLPTTKEEVDCWYQLIFEIRCSTTKKRKFGNNYSPESPVTVIDSFFSSDDSRKLFSDGYCHPTFKRTKLP